MESQLIEELMQTFVAAGPRPLSHLNENFGKGEKALIFVLEKNGGTATPGELSDLLQVGSGRIGNALKDLEAKGFVKREDAPEDRRRTLVSLTEKGKAFAEEKHAAFRGYVAALVNMLGEEDARELLRIVRKINESGLRFGPGEECNV